MDSDISLAVTTRMPYCPILTFEDDSTDKHAKDKSDCNSFLKSLGSRLTSATKVKVEHFHSKLKTHITKQLLTSISVDMRIYLPLKVIFTSAWRPQ